MKKYRRLMLGAKSIYAEDCYKNNYIGTDFDIREDLSNKLPDNWRDFNKAYIPKWLSLNPEKTKVAAGLACGALWTVSKGMVNGDIVLCPNGVGGYYVGEIISDYHYKKDGPLPHRRDVKWYPVIIERSAMSEALRNSSGSIGTVSDITLHHKEIEFLIGEHLPPTIVSNDETVEDPTVFAMEMHLEDFLVQNWKQTELGKKYDIYEDEGQLVGKQYEIENGRIDILAISKDKKELLIIELKKGRASDNVVGQIQRYMGYVKEELAEKGQTVKGIIIALDDDKKIKRALAVTTNIEFYRYKVSFKLYKDK